MEYDSKPLVLSFKGRLFRNCFLCSLGRSVTQKTILFSIVGSHFLMKFMNMISRSLLHALHAERSGAGKGASFLSTTSERKLICFLVKTRFRLERPNSSRRRSRRRVIKNARDGNAAREKKSEGLPPPANDVSWRNGENFRERERERERESCHLFRASQRGMSIRVEYTSAEVTGGNLERRK